MLVLGGRPRGRGDGGRAASDLSPLRGDNFVRHAPLRESGRTLLLPRKRSKGEANENHFSVYVSKRLLSAETTLSPQKALTLHQSETRGQ